MEDLKVYEPVLEVWVKVRDEHYVYITEGAGGGLLPEDWEEGYIDYVYFEVYDIVDDNFHEYGGGMVLLKEPYQDLFTKKNKHELISQVLMEEYGEVLDYKEIEEPELYEDFLLGC